MARPKWTKDDVRGMLHLGGVFVAVGIVYGLLDGDGVIFGAIAGILLFGFMIGIGSLAVWIGRDKH